MKRAKLGPWSVVLGLALVGASGSACTAITLAEWNGYTSTDAGSEAGSTGAMTACNANYLSNLSACGACMESNCAQYIALACTIDAGSSYELPWVDQNLIPCAKDTSVIGSNCYFFLGNKGSISPSGDPAAIENNLEVCLKGACSDTCQTCPLSYAGCPGTSVKLESTTCGQCIATQCQTQLAKCCGDVATDAIYACARTAASCNGDGNCAGILDAGSSPSMCTTQVYSCIQTNCNGSCPF